MGFEYWICEKGMKMRERRE